MNWIQTTERLPLLGQRVEIKGRYSAFTTDPPISYRRQSNGSWKWESIAWQGRAGVTHWREIPRGT